MNGADAKTPMVKCLLVDDLEGNLIALSALLRQDGVELLTARSGVEALELLLAHDIALALLDVQMPGMDGFELAELMRGSERTRHVPLIFVTAGASDQRRVFAGYESGAVDFIYKPIEPHILKSKAAVFFELYRQKQRLAHELRERAETLRLNELFVAMLGHDLRNPLSAMVASASLLKRRHGDEEVQAIATRLLASGQRMGRMIEDILDLARARLGGGIPIRPQPGDLGVVVERVAQECQASRPDRAIELMRDGPLDGAWDLDRMAQLASNLIGNALHHGTAGPVHVRLDGTDPGEVVLTVANAGTIPPEILAHLFDPFRGTSREAGRGDGLGLGLYIVDRIAQAHRGSVIAQSPGDGTTRFEVRVPRRF